MPMRRPGKPALLASAVAALLLGGGLVLLLWTRAPQVPPHPLRLVTPASVIAVTAGTHPLERSSDAFRSASALPSRLAAIAPADAHPINWATARQMRIATSTGLVIWVQLAEHAGATWARVNADPLPGADAATRQQAEAIKRLRLRAYRLSPPQPHGK